MVYQLPLAPPPPEEPPPPENPPPPPDQPPPPPPPLPHPPPPQNTGPAQSEPRRPRYNVPRRLRRKELATKSTNIPRKMSMGQGLPRWPRDSFTVRPVPLYSPRAACINAFTPAVRPPSKSPARRRGVISWLMMVLAVASGMAPS